MILPKGAKVQVCSEIEPGSLIVGPSPKTGKNFCGIKTRTDFANMKTDWALNITSDATRDPYFFPLQHNPIFLNLGRDWRVDVEISLDTPSLTRRGDFQLILREGVFFFADLRDGHYLNTETGLLLNEWHNTNLVAVWSGFSILVPSEDAAEGWRTFAKWTGPSGSAS